MARSRSTMPLQGTIGNETHYRVKGKTEPRVRRAKKKSKLPPTSPLKPNANRTAFLNGIAGDLKNAFKQHVAHFASSNLYQRLNKLLRKEPGNNLLFLLRQLKDMQLNPAYPLGRFSGIPQLSITKNQKNIIVNMQVPNHEAAKPVFANCYFYQLILLCWDKNDKICQGESRKTTWINYEDGSLEFDLDFKIPKNCIDYLVCLRESLGKNDIELDEMRTQGAQVILVGSFHAARQQRLEEKLEAERKQKAVRPIRKKLDEDRVAPKKRA